MWTTNSLELQTSASPTVEPTQERLCTGLAVLSRSRRLLLAAHQHLVRQQQQQAAPQRLPLVAAAPPHLPPAKQRRSLILRETLSPESHLQTSTTSETLSFVIRKETWITTISIQVVRLSQRTTLSLASLARTCAEAPALRTLTVPRLTEVPLVLSNTWTSSKLRARIRSLTATSTPSTERPRTSSP